MSHDEEKDTAVASIVRRFYADDDALAKKVTRLSRSRERSRIEKSWNVNSLTGPQKYGQKRAIENILRKDKKYNSEKANLTEEDLILMLRGQRPSEVLDGILPDRKKQNFWLKLNDRPESSSGTQINLKNFSFLKDPENTLRGLADIAKAEARCLGARLNFCDEYSLDVAPYMLLVECWREMIPVFEGGDVDLPMQKVLAAIGVQHALGIGFRGLSNFKDVWAFPLSRRRGAGKTQTNSPFIDVPSRDFATTRFCSAIDEWLRRPEINLSLSEQGDANLMNLLGEVLENAERHSDGTRRDGSWSVSGFLARRKTADGMGWNYIASIGIVSVGDTFSDSLKRARPEQLKMIDAYIREMRRKGAKQSDETLRTLVALQDTVTCDEVADKDGRGGFGLMDMLEMVSALGQTTDGGQQPEVTIISGASCTQLKQPYNRVIRRSGSGNPRMQWFNNDCSAKVPPDEGYVFDLATYLPGTAISIGFKLDPTYLNSLFDDA